jgi:hypothetical protein
MSKARAALGPILLPARGPRRQSVLGLFDFSGLPTNRYLLKWSIYHEIIYV